jgi:predicted dithiol-disulfide oxidoreductase (DUF899 family)
MCTNVSLIDGWPSITSAVKSSLEDLFCNRQQVVVYPALVLVEPNYVIEEDRRSLLNKSEF